MTTKHESVVERLEALAEDLERQSRDNIALSQVGSPFTSLADEATAGALGREQRRIAVAIRAILAPLKRTNSRST